MQEIIRKLENKYGVIIKKCKTVLLDVFMLIKVGILIAVHIFLFLDNRFTPRNPK